MTRSPPVSCMPASPLSGWHAAGVMAQRTAPRGRRGSRTWWPVRPRHQRGWAGRRRGGAGDSSAAPAAEEIEGAADLAARLAFETTALSLPIVMRAPEVTSPAAIDVPILVGRENPLLVNQAAAQNGLDLKHLAPRQGLIAVVRAPLGGGDGLMVAGGDEAGTLAAANPWPRACRVSGA